MVLFLPEYRSMPARLGAALGLAIYLLLPLLCIWFGDEMGNYIGSLPGPAINKPTPGCFVRIGGWVLLLFPVIVVVIAAIQ